MSIEQIKQNLTKSELMDFNCLVRLGDSHELAYKTIVTDRLNAIKQDEAKDFYNFAYCS